MIRLSVNMKGSPSPTSNAFAHSPIVIGRAENSDVVVDDPKVSKRHCLIDFDDEGNLKVFDAGTTNGTYVNGRKIDQQFVAPGDKIYVGSCVIEVEEASASVGSATTTGAPQTSGELDGVVEQTTYDDSLDIRPAVVTGESEIDSVTVHGRGAVVTRNVTIDGDVPTTAFELRVPGLTPMADRGSFRVRLTDDRVRTIVSVRTDLHVPTRPASAGDTVEELKKCNWALQHLKSRRQLTNQRAQQLRDLELLPKGEKNLEEQGPGERVGAALEMSELVDRRLAEFDETIVEITAEIEELEKKRQELELQDQQASDEARMGESHPTLDAYIHFGEGDEAPKGLQVSYVVPVARWWPVYRLDLSDEGQRGTLRIDALVAQRSGEDWSGVPISLSTSRIVYDASLPTLPSLRIGRSQPKAHRGFRAPPAETDRLFESFDAAVVGAESRQPQRPATPKKMAKHTSPVANRSAQLTMQQPGPPPAAAPQASDDAYATREFAAFEEEQLDRLIAQSAQDAPAAPGQAQAASSGFGRTGGPPPAPAQAGPGGGGGSMMYAKREAPTGTYDRPETSYEPDDNWLRFDRLILAGPTKPNRGKLQPRPADGTYGGRSLDKAVSQASRANAIDPIASRGTFDYRYETQGHVDVPSDGRVHRIEVTAASGDTSLFWRTVPREDDSVYRIVELDNPHDSPLLTGPVEVYAEGSLVTRTHCERVGPGGELRVGLGVDERLRVARNAHVEEESAGLLGGKRAILHEVDVELRSGLGFPAKIEVIDRIPVTDDDNIDVELVSSSPTAEEYDQEEEERPIRGGLRWEMELGPGGTATVEFAYRVVLRAKDEILGGNRRE